MPAFSASAPGKIILFGEHAVVYGRPALAVPVTQVQAKAIILANPSGSSSIEAPDIAINSPLDQLPTDHPLAQAVSAVQTELGLKRLPAFRLKITSTIPVASGLGSGAAVSVVIARALSAFLGRPLTEEQVNAIAYRVEQTHHGTPSGIDNTVITYAQPVWYVRGSPFERLNPGLPFTIVIADTGIKVFTGMVVGDMRRRWTEAPGTYEDLFDRIGAISREARQLIENGRPEEIGALMVNNHELLRQLDVSCHELDMLVTSALNAGAIGAKMCGAGRGGNMIALVHEDNAPTVAAALSAAGAVRTIITRVK